MLQRIGLLVALASCIVAAATYSYDDAGRLVKCDYGAAGSISYTYDNAGNVTSRTVQSSGTAAGVIASARLVRSNDGETSIELRGTNLAAEGTSFIIDGKPAHVLSRCNATVSPTCQTDQVSIMAPDFETAGKVGIVVTNGIKSSPPFSVLIHARQMPKR